MLSILPSCVTLVRMGASKTARERARDEVDAEIMRVGREQLADVGSAALSLRSVARELGMVSSAVYRYVSSRDELLTRLIDSAYTSLGEAVELDVTDTAGRPPADRWASAANTVRTWAIARPHEYALLYGSPVPGYVAPDTMSVSGTRASRALITIVRDAHRDGLLDRPANRSANATTELTDDFDALRVDIDLDVDDAMLLDVLVAWTQLFGLVSFETFGQTRGLVTDDQALFDGASRRMARLIGLATHLRDERDGPLNGS